MENIIEKYDWLKSIYSDGSKFFISNPYPKQGETIKIRLRVYHNEDLDHVLLKSKEHGRETFYEMEVVETKGNLDYYETSVTVDEEIFHYHFYLVANNDTIYYSQYRIQDYIPDEVHDFKILVDYEAPKWLKDTVFYQIYPDRFNSARDDLGVKEGEYSLDGEATRVYTDWSESALEYDEGRNVDFYNGDLYGIIEKLDYIQDLGANAIYLNPIFYAPSAHRFDTLDFYEVDPHLGGNEAFEELMQAVHDRDMHLVLDVSIDHTSSDAKWFNRDCIFYPKSVGAYHNPEAKEREYFTFNEDNTYEAWDDIPTMPKLNFESEALRDVLYKDEDSVVKYWLKEPYKIDGWRFDVADVMAHDKSLRVYYEVWQELFDEIKDTNPEAMILAEDWGDCSELFFANGYDSTMNYFGFTRPVREFLGEKDLFSQRQEILNNIDSTLSARQMLDRMVQAISLVPYQVSLQQFNLLDSHDVLRIYNKPDISLKAYYGALNFLFTFPGTPNVYYGDERLLPGHYTTVEGARFAMDFSEIEDEDARENFKRYKKLAQLKRSEAALIDGGFMPLYADETVAAFARFSSEKTFISIISKDKEEKEISLDLDYLGFAEDAQISEVFNEDLDYKFKNNKFVLKLAAEQSYLIELV